MAILRTIKRLLGIGRTSDERGASETAVTVEREADPDAETESAVKGTDAGATTPEHEPPGEAGAGASAAAGTNASASTESMVDEREATEEPAGAAEPGEAAGPESDDVTTDVGSVEPGADEVGEEDEATGEEATDEDAEPTADEAEPEGSDAGGGPGEDVPVDELKGIGPAYAERLSGLGIETVADLAAADADAVASETDVSEKRVSDWIDRAREYGG